jgi:hypothetical protein
MNSRRVERDGYVYFVGTRSGEHPVKIGWSENPAANLLESRRWNWVPLELLGVISVPRVSKLWGTGARSLERLLHTAFYPERLHSEWFERSPKLNELVQTAGNSKLDHVRVALVAMDRLDAFEQTFWLDEPWATNFRRAG